MSIKKTIASPSPLIHYVLFFATGVATVQMGIVLPQMQNRAHAADSATGLLLAMQFIGQLIGPLFVTRRASRAAILGMVITALAAIPLATPRGLHPATLLLFGLGLGITMTAINILAGREATSALRIRRMQILNAFWPLGAAAAPWFIRINLKLFGTPNSSYAALSICIAVLLIAFLLRSRGLNLATRSASEEEHPLPIPQLALLCLFALLAVGIETSLANWIPTFAVRYLTGVTAASLAATAFWCGILTGRAIADKFLQRLSWRTFGVTTSLLCAATILGIITAHTTTSLVIAAFASAFCVAPLYPAVLAHSVHVRWKNAVFVSAGIGSALIPWLVGQASAFHHSLRSAIFIPAIAAIVLAIALFTGIRKTTSLQDTKAQF